MSRFVTNACMRAVRPSSPVWALAFGLGLAAATIVAAEPPDFEKAIRPLFAEHCVSCHGQDKQKSNLRLDRKIDAFRGGDEGVVLVPGKSTESRLFQFVFGADPKKLMPPKGKRLSEQQVAVIKEWIDAGAPWPDDAKEIAAEAAKKTHWAFRAPVRPDVPYASEFPFSNSQLSIRTPVDSFIAARHGANKLTPAPEASRRALVRRLSLDLLGLPPSPDEVESFLNDTSPRAYEAVVERLLASPHYGERWGRHWLDLARWAESEGFEGNTHRSGAWRYRDYVVKSFNDDKPHDAFLRQQLAGDELEPYSDENIIATGFLSAARFSHNEEDKVKQRQDVLIDVANAAAGATLGLTMSCAQCHDHKFDPISAEDYYRFKGFFDRGQMVAAKLKDEALWQEFRASRPPELDAMRTLRDALHAKAEKHFSTNQVAKLTPEARRVRNSHQQLLPLGQRGKPSALRKEVETALEEGDRKLYAELMKRLDDLEFAQHEEQPQAWAFYSPASSPHPLETLVERGDYPLPFDPDNLRTHQPAVFLRGDFKRPGSALTPGWPRILGATPADIGPRPRLALANWLTSTNNPLTARVWVNFVWQHHLGRGLVATPANFGVQGEKPSHPELLEWLACEFMAPREPGASAWSTKHLHRLIVLSATYRQASAPNPANAKRDPDNVLLWRWTPRRLEAEAIRDTTLAVGGDLDRRIGGASVSTNELRTTTRRSLYYRQTRGEFPSALALFDGPSANEVCHRRHTSTVALQPLQLLNDPQSVARAEIFAERAEREAGSDRGRQVERAFVLAFNRMPDTNERAMAERFFTGTARGSTLVAPALPSADGANKSNPTERPHARRPLVEFCQALLNANEFIYLE